ncbi:hypothetical protein ACNKXS_13820 [Christiangramia marina]|uniref:hypothetical protein n=1 Tax=Christiangramia marina TaxID=409436 RepID=UPI003AA80AEE
MRRTLLYLLTFLTLCSCEEILLEIDIKDELPELLAPTNDSELKASNIDFEWQEINGASSYRIQIVKPSFEEVNQFLVNEIVEETSFTKNLSIGDYEWRITALNSGYTSRSTQAFFEVQSNDDFSSFEINLLEPDNNLKTNVALQNLRWEPMESAEVYRLQIFTENELILETTTDSTSYEYLFDNGRFIWQVRGETEIENTFYSNHTIIIDTTDPEVARLISSKNDTILTNNTINFMWERLQLIETEAVDSIYIFEDLNLEVLVEKDTGTGAYTSILDRNKTYYWFVRSFDEAGNESRSSENFSFTIN